MTEFSVKKHVVGRDGFIWWIGQVANDSGTFNDPGSTAGGEPLEQQAGFGQRYQVRIMGYHTADPVSLPDDQLPWASVMYPVTAGGGVSSKESARIDAGNFVYGFFLDGEDGQHPVIMGILGYNQYDTLYKKWDGLPGFVPFGGWNYTKVPDGDITDKSQPRGEKTRTESSQTNSITPKTNTNTTTGVGGHQRTVEDTKQLQQGSEATHVDAPSLCPKAQSPTGMRLEIANMIKRIENAQKGVKNLSKSITNPLEMDGAVTDLQTYIQDQVSGTSQKVAAFVAHIFTEMYANIVKNLNKAIKPTNALLQPDQQQKLKDTSDTALDIIACFIKRIIKNLLKMVGRILLDLVNRYINVPLCAAETVLGAILGKLTGLLDGLLSKVVKPIQAIIGGALDLVGSALAFLKQILSFLQCEEPPSCPEVDEWSLFGGSSPVETFDVNSLIQQAEDFAAGVSKVTDPDNFDFDGVDFSDVFNIEGCVTSAFPCGPPKIVFWGGSGKGATGNAIVSAAGDLLGVDIINSGSGYEDRRPFLSIKDECGRGKGGTGRPILGSVCLQEDGTYAPCDGGEYVGVVGVVIEESGYGYLPVPDGSLGGEGRTWADADQTIVKRSNGTWDLPYSAGDIIMLQPGDRICTPLGSTATFNTTDDNFVELLGGCNDMSNHGVVTAPIAPDKAVAPKSEYPVVLYICDIIITNPGFGYKEGDEIVVEPANGAKLTPIFNEMGQLTSVKIINGGEGFQEIPKIYIESDEGFNAEMIPKFCVDRVVGVDEMKEPLSQDGVISVVDCVGTV